MIDDRDDRWRDSYDEWKLRSPYDEPGYDDDDDRYADEPWCPECGLDHPDGEHKIWCSDAAPTRRVRLYRAWHWHIKHWRVGPLPSIAMVTRRVWHWWHFDPLAKRLRKRIATKPPVIDDDLPF